jgi:hypothetical protein
VILSPSRYFAKIAEKYLESLNFAIFINQSKVIGFWKKLVKIEEHDENYNLALAND